MMPPKKLAQDVVQKLYGPRTISVPENIVVARVLWTREEAQSIIESAIEQALKASS